jgi:HEAT repeat protein
LTHPVVARLRDPDPAVRREACREAADDPSAVLLIESLGAALGDPDPSVGRAASRALVGLAPHHADVDALLRRALHGDDARLRFGAARTRARLAPPEPALLPALVEALGDASSEVRWSAARIFVDLGRLHGEALRVALALARGDASARVRRMAVFCAARLAPRAEQTLELLRAAARDEDREVRRAAELELRALDLSDQKTRASTE